MSWILSSINIEAMRFDQYEKWFYKSDRETELLNKKVLIEGDCYYHEHLFINEVISIQDVVDGSYAVALLHDNYILCTSDSICTRNIYYFQNNDFYCVSSSLRLLINAISNCIALSLDSVFLYTYLVYGHNQYRTPFSNINKLPAGCCLKITDKIHLFHHINFDDELNNARKIIEKKDDRAEFAVEILKSHCKSIVEKNMGGTILTEISGGVDSSLLTGLLHEAACGKNVILHGYSYTYKDQKIGNELRFMKDVAKKNKIQKHIITDLGFDSIKISQHHNEGFPDISLLNDGLLCRTRDAVSGADVTVSGQGGDICIGDYYCAFADKGSVWASAYHDSLNDERFILRTLIAKYVCPVYLSNIIPFHQLNGNSNYPLWITKKMKHLANQTLNKAYGIIHRSTKSYGMRIALFEYLNYNGLMSDDILPYTCFFPYFTRDMVVYGRLFNDWYVKKGTYRYNIKSASRKYLPLSVFLRTGKSRMDTVSRQFFVENTHVYRDLILKSVLLKKMSIDKEQVLAEMQMIKDGKNYDVNYSLRLLSLLVWHDNFSSKYPAEKTGGGK